jgi:hypothetical protein
MKTTLKIVLAAAATAALLAAPAAAKTANHADAAELSRTAPYASQGEFASAPSGERGAGFLQDCVRVAFPQCSGGN